MQLERHPGRLERGGRVPEILARQRVVREFLAAAALPQKIDVDPAGNALRFRHETRERRRLESQQHRGRLHLGALAMRRLDLERGVVVGEDGADLEVTLFFIENVHRGTR